MRLVRTLAALLALPLAALPAYAATFSAGEFVTFSQGEWGEMPAGNNVGTLLENNYNSVFAPSDLLEVGIHGVAGFSIVFDNPDDLIAYLPANGTAGVLTADLLDPATSASGVFGGEVVAAALNVAFSDAGLLAHPLGVPVGDLVFQNLDMLAAFKGPGGGIGPEITELDGLSVRQVLAEADLVLGGASTPFNPDEMASVLNLANGAFDAGQLFPGPDAFLAFPPSTTTTVPEPPAWAMLLIGLAGLGFVRYRKAKVVRTVLAA